MDNSCVLDVDLSDYEKIMGALVKRGIKTVTYETLNPNNANQIIIRHDIDIALNLALPVAKMENSLEMSAYYFVLTTSPLYNLKARETQTALSGLVDLGHHVGLHFDILAHPNAPSNLNTEVLSELIEEDFEVLLKATNGRATRCVSFHKPPRVLVGNNLQIGGFTNAYHSRFFKPSVHYISDSANRWGKDGDITSLLKKGPTRAIHFLTHPIWWTTKEMTTEQKLISFLHNKSLEDWTYCTDVVSYLYGHPYPGESKRSHA